MERTEKNRAYMSLQKKFIVSIFLIFLFSVSFGQTKEIVIYCKIYPSIGGLVVDYYGMEKYLPDSTKADVLVDYKKKYRLRNSDADNAILLMGVDGWRLLSSYYDPKYSQLTYILSKEIYLGEKALQSYLEKLRNSR